jgi:DNA-directed RNA polymerase I, II, and III subunit RPABC2
MSRKETNQKIDINEESDHFGRDVSDVESDIELDATSDIGSDIEYQADDNIDESEVLDDKDDDDGDDGDDRVYMKKFPSRVLANNSEITLVAPEQRVTSECMTLYEYAMVIGTRATHISDGAPLYVDTSGLSNARDIAIKELDEKKCPLSISRRVGRKLEVWEVNEMTKPLL